MSDEPQTRGPGRPGPYVIVGVLLVIGIAVPLIVPIYAHAEPSLIGLPFFYWYQMLWVFIDAIVLWICYAIVRREDRRRREAVGAPSSRTERKGDLR
jgi:uncharacterized BrkB/YihY/UPF0761 family membrane protein